MTNKVYVTNTQLSYTVTEIDGATNQTQAISVGVSPASIAINSVTNTLYVAGGSHGDYWVDVIDGVTLAMTSVDSNNPSGAILGAPAVNPMTNKIYVPHQLGTVAVIDGATLNVTSVPVGQAPQWVAVDAAINQVYVVNGYASPTPGTTVRVIDGATNSTTTLPVGVSPAQAALSPTTHRVYVTNSCGNDTSCPAGAQGTVSVIEAAH